MGGLPGTGPPGRAPGGRRDACREQQLRWLLRERRYLSPGVSGQRIIAQAVAEARARNRRATIAVADRVGNVLVVFQMNGAAHRPHQIRPVQQEAPVPGRRTRRSITYAGAEYLRGHRQGHHRGLSIERGKRLQHPHGEPDRPGVLQSGRTRPTVRASFGVQFSQLPCGDLVQQGEAVGIGPRRSPLGLSADPGGLPLYFKGTPVGGIGVIADGIYGVDANIFDVDQSVDELIALAGTVGFEAPENRRADRIAVGGLLLRFSDADAGDLLSDPGSAPAFSSVNGRLGGLVDAERVLPESPGRAARYRVRPADVGDHTGRPGRPTFSAAD